MSNLVQLFRKYENWAYDILTRCGENPGRCDSSDLLIRVLPQWGNVTCLNIADSAEDIKFMSHSVVEKLLHQKWFGRIRSDDVIRTDSLKNALQPLWVNMIFKDSAQENCKNTKRKKIKNTYSLD